MSAAGAALLLFVMIIGAGRVFAIGTAASAGTSGNLVRGGLTWTYQQPGLESVAADKGATATGQGTVRFTLTGGSYDAATGTGTARFQGRMVLGYTGRTVTVTDPEVVLDKSKDVLRATVTTASTSPAPTALHAAAAQASPTPSAADLATLGGTAGGTGATPATSGETVTWNALSTALTESGAAQLAASPKDSVGAVSLTLTTAAVVAATTSATSTASATTSASATATPTGTPCATETATASSTVTATASSSATATATASDTASPCATSTNSGSNGNGTGLANTGTSPLLLPLTGLGGVLTVGGIGTIFVARRRAAYEAAFAPATGGTAADERTEDNAG